MTSNEPVLGVGSLLNKVAASVVGCHVCGAERGEPCKPRCPEGVRWPIAAALPGTEPRA